MRLTAWEQIKKLLENRWAGIACVVLAILNKSLISYFSSSLRDDKSLYLLFAKSFLHIGKLAEPVNLLDHGSLTYLYEPAVHSPLYSLIAAPLLWLTNSFFWTQFIIAVLGWILFYTALYRIAAAILRKKWLVNIFVLCSGFFLYPHELSSTPKDTLAVGFSLWSIYLMYRFLIHPQWKTTALLSFTIICLGTVKLLYLPLAVLFIFLLGVFVFMERSKKHFLQLFVLAGVVCFAGFLVHQLILAPAYQLHFNNHIQLPSRGSMIKQGFYPQNLLLTYPFVSASYLNTELWGVQIEKFTPLSFTEVMRGLFAMDVILLGVFIIVSLFYSRQIIENRVLFFLIGAALIMMTVTFFLSASQEVLVSRTSFNTWTFVTDARSFLIPILCIQLVLFLFVFCYPKSIYLRLIFFLLFFFELVHGMYFSFKQITTGTEQMQRTDKDNRIVGIMKKEENKGAKLITSDAALRRFAQTNNLPVYAFTNQKPDLSWMKQGDVFFIATYKDDSMYVKQLPAENLKLVDTIYPLILHRLQVK